VWMGGDYKVFYSVTFYYKRVMTLFIRLRSTYLLVRSRL